MTRLPNKREQERDLDWEATIANTLGPPANRKQRRVNERYWRRHPDQAREMFNRIADQQSLSAAGARGSKQRELWLNELMSKI